MNRDINHIQGDERAYASSWSDRLSGSWLQGLTAARVVVANRRDTRRPVSRLRFPYPRSRDGRALDGSTSKDIRYHGVQVSFTIHRRVVERWFLWNYGGVFDGCRYFWVELKARGRKVHHTRLQHGLPCERCRRRLPVTFVVGHIKRIVAGNDGALRSFGSVRGWLASISRFDWRVLGLTFGMGGGFMGLGGRFLGLETGRRFAYEGFRGSDACVVDTRLLVGFRASLSGVVFMGLPRLLGLSFSTDVVLLLSRIVSGIVMSCIGYGSAALRCAYGVTGARYPSPCGMLDRRMVVL
jgi:hypothetical protein